MTTLFYKALKLQAEIWCWSILGLKGFTEMIFSAFISSSCSSLNEINCVFSHDVMAAMFVSQTSPVGVELFSYVNAFFCSNKFA